MTLIFVSGVVSKKEQKLTGTDTDEYSGFFTG